MDTKITISMLIARLEKLKKEHGDLAVCLNDEHVGFIPIIEAGFENGVHVIDVNQEEDGIHPHQMTTVGEGLPAGDKVKVAVIEWSC
jgi:hypothetical protein